MQPIQLRIDAADAIQHETHVVDNRPEAAAVEQLRERGRSVLTPDAAHGVWIEFATVNSREFYGADVRRIVVGQCNGRGDAGKRKLKGAQCRKD